MNDLLHRIKSAMEAGQEVKPDGDGWMTTNDWAKHWGISGPAASNHLMRGFEAGIMERKRGKRDSHAVTFYREKPQEKKARSK